MKSHEVIKPPSEPCCVVNYLFSLFPIVFGDGLINQWLGYQCGHSSSNCSTVSLSNALSDYWQMSRCWLHGVRNGLSAAYWLNQSDYRFNNTKHAEYHISSYIAVHHSEVISGLFWPYRPSCDLIVTSVWRYNCSRVKLKYCCTRYKWILVSM